MTLAVACNPARIVALLPVGLTKGFYLIVEHLRPFRVRPGTAFRFWEISGKEAEGQRGKARGNGEWRHNGTA